MRKLVCAALAAGILSIAAVAIAAAHDDHGTDEWPTTCVDLNDIVEEHLGNKGNVGIYQNTFGDQAETACQNDHRNDVIAVFGWAIATETGGQAEASDLELDWPTTCVELNDIVEGHLGNEGNVGIYQNTFGDQAEAACQNDHRNDVRSVFAWAIGGTTVEAPAPQATPQPTPAPTSTPSLVEAFQSKKWIYRVEADPISQKDRHRAILIQSNEDGFLSVSVRCWLDRENAFQILVNWETGRIEGDLNNQVKVEYRFVGDDPRAELWNSSGSGAAVFAPSNIEVRFARQLLSSSGLHFRAQDYETLRPYVAGFELDGQSDPNHPVRKVMQACGITV